MFVPHSYRAIITSTIVLFTGSLANSASLLSNPDFDTDLSSWTVAGNAVHSTDFAVLSDDGATSSTIFQGVAAGPSLFALTFDFIGGLSSAVPVGRLPDTAFASVYLGDSAFVSPADAGSFDEVISLFDVDSNGVNSLHPDAMISAHPTRAGWSQLSIQFATGRTNVTPFVELLDQNAIDNDSVVAVDTFNLIVVPEPSTAILGLLGCCVLVIARRR